MGGETPDGYADGKIENHIDFTQQELSNKNYSKQVLVRILEEIEGYATEWLWFYNHNRLHTANGGKSPLMVV
ncbi:MAG: hypothetical protein H7A08_02810 [Oceanospirillaceae bacterium]|nr:hypothetical protein [Oceanospirillaceae bacterium]